MKSKYVPYVLIIFLTGFVFWLSNNYFNGTLQSLEALAKELKTDPEHVYLWKIADEPPFKYRILFPAITMSIYNLAGFNSPQRFYYIYYFVSMLFTITTVLSLYIFLKKLSFSLTWRIVGILFLITAPPFLFAYSVPVHTKEDMLGYTLLLWGLIFILEEKRWPFLIVAILGVCARETLLILPFIYFFFSNDRFSYKILCTLIPALVLFSIRFFIGYEMYDTWLGLRWNLNNPMQVMAFGFLSFYLLWITFTIELFTNRKKNLPLMRKSAPWAALLILGTTFGFGIFNEMRLSFLLFPWVIVLSLRLIERNAPLFLAVINERAYRIYTFFLLAAFVAVGYWLIENIPSFMPPSRFAKYYSFWIIIILIYSYITLVSLPLFYKVIAVNNKSFKYLNDTQKQ